jgi:hypothetical protein
MAALSRKPRTCAATRADGNACTVHVISAAGAAKLLDRGIALVENPGDYCAMHCRTPAARREMSRKGGRWSPKLASVNQKEPKREPMPDDHKLATKRLIRELLTATLEGVFPVEPDVRRVSVGAFLALQMFDPGDNGDFLLSLMPRGLHARTSSRRSPKTNFEPRSTSSSPTSKQRRGSYSRNPDETGCHRFRPTRPVESAQEDRQTPRQPPQAQQEAESQKAHDRKPAEAQQDSRQAQVTPVAGHKVPRQIAAPVTPPAPSSSGTASVLMRGLERSAAVCSSSLAANVQDRGCDRDFRMVLLGVIGLGRSGKALLTRVFVVGAVRAVAAGSPLVAAARISSKPARGPWLPPGLVPC